MVRPLWQSDDDQVIVWAARARGSMSIITGAGEDWAFVGGATIGDGIGGDQLYIRTGSSRDQVTVMGATVHGSADIQTYDSLSELDDDGVYFDFSQGVGHEAIIDGDANVRMGGGKDYFAITDPGDAVVFWEGLTTHGSLIVDTGAGDDTLFVREANIGDESYDDVGLDNFVINTGAGADVVTMSNVNVGAFLDLQLYSLAAEADADSAAFDHVYAHHDLSIRSGAGNDTLRLQEAGAYAYLNVDAGDGNDTLDLVDFVFGLYGANLLGGNGVDSLRKSSQAYLGSLVQTGWEWINGRNQAVLGTRPTNGGVLTQG